MSTPVFYLESDKQRYHTKIDCPVLLREQDIEIVIVKQRPNVRPCALCGHDVASPALPRTEEPRG